MRRVWPANAVTGKLLQIQEGTAFAFIPPPIQGLGNAGGFEYMLQDRGAAGSNSFKPSRTISLSRGTRTRC